MASRTGLPTQREVERAIERALKVLHNELGLDVTIDLAVQDATDLAEVLTQWVPGESEDHTTRWYDKEFGEDHVCVFRADL